MAPGRARLVAAPWAGVALLLATLGSPVSTGAQQPASATYSVTFEGMWNAASTPDGVVGGAHFTTLIGAVHNSDVTFWAPDGQATPGVEAVAELGVTSRFVSEYNAVPAADRKALIRRPAPAGPTGTTTFTIEASTAHPLVTLLSMIGPSPDWFVGVSGLSLRNGEGWQATISRDLFPYDAGTEDGTEFSLNNRATNPRGTIASIRGQGKFSNAPMARLTFVLQESGPPPTPDPDPDPPPPSSGCTPTTTALQFDGGYEVAMCYRTPDGQVGQAKSGIWASGQSGLLWFFDRENAEVLVKVLDACSHNGHRWAFAAPVTTLEFNLWITGPNGKRWTHGNAQGRTAATRSDTSAFRCADEPAGR